MKRFILSVTGLLVFICVYSQSLTVTWPFSDTDNLSKDAVDGAASVTSLVTTSFSKGGNIASTAKVEQSNADSAYNAVTYNPVLTALTPSTKVTSKTAGHSVSFTVTPVAGHTFKPVTVEFDAAKIGTDGGNVDVYYNVGSGSEQALQTGLSPLRNKITASNTTGLSHYSISLGDVMCQGGQPFTVTLYIMNINGADASSPKSIAFRNVTVKGAVDEGIFDVPSLIKSITCTASEVLGELKSIDLSELVKDIKNGGSVTYPVKLFGDPDDFEFNVETTVGYTCSGSYTRDTHTLSVDVMRGEESVLKFDVRFKVTYRTVKPEAKPLNRGLMAVSLTGAGMGSGNLVSWRHRASDDQGVKYKLYRGTSAETQTTVLNGGKYIVDRTNFGDAGGSASSYYRLEIYNRYGEMIGSEVSRKTWSNQTMLIPVSTPANSINGATYSPNDASYCDMDGDGEYEIILKWSPSDEKDAASSGTTSEVVMDCYKLDGTRLWRIHMGNNMFTSAHTIEFIAWDFDGDGYGELMMKTAPGTIDGEGNYVLLGNDDPTVNLKSSRGKQDHGSEYITVFDGVTGGELATIPYHTAYGDVSTSIWGDSNQNRSERYLAALAYLDGPDANPSPIFARGYYSGAFVGAYDWDGTKLKARWVSRNTTSGQGLWGEGAHWIAVGDCDGDDRQEIVYGSAALDHDGSLLYRTGLKHGDALHLGDFLPDRPGMEVFMVHEASPYGCDLRDAKTGELLLHQTASGDTGRGICGHFDSKYKFSQFSHSSDAGMHLCTDGTKYTEGWNPGGGGSMNNRIYWDGDLYDEHYDKSVLAKWNGAGFDRIQVNKTNYTVGTLNNGSKYNPCVLGDLLGDWREELVLWTRDATTGETNLVINATSYPTGYRIPHLMDDLNYRVQVVNQNCTYNQPPHLSVDPAIAYASNPNVASQEDEVFTGIEDIIPDEASAAGEEEKVIYNLQGIRVKRVTTPGIYIVNGMKVVVRD